MSTPSDRIRQAAEEAERKKQIQQTRAAEEESKQQKRVSDMAQRANQAGNEFLTRAREILNEAGRTVHLRLERHDVTKMSPGFLLSIGKARRGERFIRAQIEAPDRWSVSVYSTTTGQSTRHFPDDKSLLQKQNAILEPLLKEAVVAAVNGEEEAPED